MGLNCAKKRKAGLHLIASSSVHLYYLRLNVFVFIGSHLESGI